MTSSRKQILIAMIILFLLCSLFFNTPMFLLIPFALGIIPLILLNGFANPSLFCLIFFTFCLFRIQEFIPQLEGFRIPMVSAILGIISLLYNILIGKTIVYWRREMTYYTLFFLQVSASVVLAYDFQLSSDLWVNLFSKTAIIFFLICWSIRSEQDFKWVNIITILCGTIIACIALLNQYYNVGMDGTRTTILTGQKSFLSDPNDLAFTLLIPLSFSCAMLFIKSVPTSLRSLGMCSSFLIMCAIIVTQSRGGLLGVVGILIYFFSQRIKSIVPILLLLISLFTFFYFAADMSQRQTFNEQGQLDESSSGRLHAWKAAINMSIHHPIFGVGLNGFTPNFAKYAIGPGNTQLTTHNSWLLVLAESGFIGCFLFVLSVYLAIKNTQISIRRIIAPDKKIPHQTIFVVLSYGLLGSLVGYCISGSFLSQGFSWPIYILISLSIALSHRIKNT